MGHLGKTRPEGFSLGNRDVIIENGDYHDSYGKRNHQIKDVVFKQ
jgi:hypothetical protein